MYKEFANLPDVSHCGLLCVLDANPCDMFMVLKGNCMLGSVTSQDEALDDSSISSLVLDENCESILYDWRTRLGWNGC